MADSSTPDVPVLTPVARPLSLIPVGLKEAALDSPTFRATVHHFGEQIDVVEKWLESYVKAAQRLSNEVSGIENIINTYLQWATPPAQVSEAILDHDYTSLALKRYNEGAKEFWSSTIKWMKKVESSVIDPIRAYIASDLATLKNYRRVLDQCQRNFDSQIARYASQSKTKEPSALREDAFQLHEARRAYLKASMDFCTAAPQARSALDKLLVRIFSDRWKDMKNTRDALAGNLAKWAGDMDRIRGWSREMENSERVFKRELAEARKSIEESAQGAMKPSRDLDDYAKSTVAYLGQAPTESKERVVERGEKQGWLFQRTVQGKPARTVWVRRWYYLKHGIFGYLSNNPRNGAVEESEKIGVLLCGVRPAFQDERRFCFEVKTKDASIELQAETQLELMSWISTFEAAKRKALENPASTEAIAAGSKSVDAAFSISPPVAPEFAAKNPEVREDDMPPERSNTLGLEPPSTLLPRASTDVGKRSMIEQDESKRERLMQKLDLHRSKGSISPAPGQPLPMSGIASLISASHTVLPLGGAGHNLTPSLSLSTDFKAVLASHIPPSSLAPASLANPPTPTNLSRTAVAVVGEKNLTLGASATDGGMPGGIMANIWGTNNWGYLNRLERGEVKAPVERRRSMSQPPSPHIPQDAPTMSGETQTPAGLTPIVRSPSPSPGTSPLPHRKTMSMTPDIARTPNSLASTSSQTYPNYYPLSLKAQDAQFRTLFPEVSREDKLVMVFRATWQPTDQSEFPGRVYVTMNDMYFYSHHLGLVLISGVSFDAISEITAAPGKDSDFVFLHLRPDVSVDGASRITLRTYLEPLKLLQKRLMYLTRNADSAEPDSLEEVIKTLIKMEVPNDENSPSLDSWEDVSPFTPMDGPPEGRSTKVDNRAGFRIDGTLFPDPSKAIGRNATKFKLPAQPVIYVPQGMDEALVERDFNITAKALFHVVAGDKSAVWQMLDRENGAEGLLQGPWVKATEQSHHRREFKYTVKLSSTAEKTHKVVDTQIIDVFNDHLCYVITERRTPWSLPHARDFSILSKIVVTHVAKSKCRFAVYAKIEWRKKPVISRRLIEKRALADAKIIASSLTGILADQVQMMGSDAYANSRKAVQIFGNVGVSKDTLQPVLSDLPTSDRERIRPYTIGELVIAGIKAGAVNTMLAVLGALIHLAQALAKVMSAHSVLVLVLAFSCIANMYFANKDTWRWYRDRQAKSFMRGVGLHPPSTGLGHSIWLKDLDALPLVTASVPAIGDLNSTASSPCRQNFNSLLAQTSPSSPPFVSNQAGQNSDTKTLNRLQRSRYTFGTYRHDLLVALKVVDKIEKEAINAEWEGWVRSEVGKCKATKKMMIMMDDSEEEGDKSMKEWWERYCGSCEGEAESMLQPRR